MASTDALPVPKKNVAYRVYTVILDADGDPVTGATGLDSEISKDGGAFADCTNEATEIGTSGFYYLDLTSTEMNADAVCIRVQTSSSGAKTTPIIMYPQESGDIPATVEALNANVITATAINADAITAAKIADGAIDAATFATGAITAAAIAADAIGASELAADAVTEIQAAVAAGAVASVTGAVGSVTGNVGGNVTGSVGSVAAGGITASSIAADAIGASELAADAVTEIQSGLATAAALSTVAGYLDTEITTALADLDDIQTRLPAALVSGRIDASVGAMAADVLTASALSAGAVDEILDDTIGDGTITVRQALRVLIAGMAGKLSGAATTTVTIRNTADSANVIVATVDADGNRSAVTVTP